MIPFEAALYAMKMGKHVARGIWTENDGPAFIQIMQPTRGSLMTVPFFSMWDKEDGYGVWLPSHVDLLAEDWSIV